MKLEISDALPGRTVLNPLSGFITQSWPGGASEDSKDSMTPKVSLSDEEKHELKKLEKIITAGFLHMRDCAEALKVIKEKKLYRASHSTFQDYCLAKWGKDRSAVHYMLQASEQRKQIVENFNKNVQAKSVQAEVEMVSNASDSAVREMAKVPKRKQRAVVKEAAKISDPPTAKAIKFVATEPEPEEAAERATVKSIAIDLVEKVRDEMSGAYTSYDGRTVKAFAKILTEKMEEIL